MITQAAEKSPSYSIFERLWNRRITHVTENGINTTI